ncbi:hypothetical protein SARC_09388 [Sphaeroforma arctica JP610]|uniref:5'-Nucleotidase C-terminal domain-containing protein n=1 Tax=Sphaeroforma arctica JP610 TaxID=667725 RepID=A0A0L0FN15_9EUKA|nr:hypothetical protein SARC_09388 [Sphaeroforma arctica JP610]KNC78170.1 hypothetical protein SARC_09388 [Sphaeroforma arctica JP610]|eukprot:XP_014152072.1 hypothetical protein SARC_09388 [Sphaeroforma arctica JP610]
MPADMATSRLFDIITEGGFLQLATLLKAHRREKDCKFIVAGDFLGGSAMAVAMQGRNVIEVLDAMETDYVVLGNHEFDYTADVTRALIKETNFKWLGSNVREADTGDLMDGVTDTETFTIECHEVRGQNMSREDTSGATTNVILGLFGVCTDYTVKLSTPGPSVVFEDVVETSKKCVDHLVDERNAEAVVCISHVSLDTDREIAKHVGNLDAIIGGHDHMPFGEYYEDTFIFKCGENAHWLGILDLDVVVEYEGGERTVSVLPSWSMVANKGYDLDPGIAKIHSKYTAKLREMRGGDNMDEVICKVIGKELLTFSDVVRRKEAAFPAVLADAMHAHYRDRGAALAVINGGFVRGNQSYPVGTSFTMFHAMNEIPFPKPDVLIRIKGVYFREALECMLSVYPKPAGLFPHVSSTGHVVFDDDKPPGSRLVTVTVGGAPLDDDREYMMVISIFMYLGGDGNEPWTKGELIANDNTPISKSLIAHLKTLEVFDANISGRVNLLHKHH